MPSATSKDGTKIVYEQTGNGPTLVLVGGALQTRSDQLMGKLVPLLAGHFTVISYDRRGRGESGDTLPYASEREIEDLDAVTAAGGGPFQLFGNSSGGNLAMLAASRLKRVAKVAAYEAPFIPESQLGSADGYLDALRQALAAHEPGKAVGLFMKRIGVPAPMRFVMRLTPIWPRLMALAPTLVYDGMIVGDGSVPVELTTTTTPVLLLTGENARMQQAARSVASLLPSARHEVLSGQSHAVAPEALARALIAYFVQ